MTAPVRPHPALPQLTEWLALRTGLDFTGCHRKRMTAAVQAAFVESGAPDHRAFADMLLGDSDRLDELVDQLTVGETYFMREPAHFELLRATVIPERLAARPGPLRIWSAGCASGEEPYSVAITLDEARLLAASSILGTDLSEHALQRARRGVYGRWSLRRCDDEQRARWFESVGTQFRLADRYRGAVEFRAAGLLEGPPARSFDVVVCRNVLIYLTEEAIDAAAAAFHDALVPGGWLLIGASDPPLQHRGLARVRHGAGVAYRRGVVPAAGPPTSPGPRDATGAAHRTPVRTAPLRRERNERPGPRRSVAPPTPPPEVLDADVRALQAAAHLEGGRHGDAVREATAALFLDPTLISAHVLLAHAAEHEDDRATAVRSLRNALALLVDHPADDTVPLLDEPAERVTQAVLAALSRLEALT